MSETKRNSAPKKRGRTRNLPPGLTILHEDRDLLIVNKPAGLLSIATETEPDKTAYAYLTDYVKKGNPKAPHRIFIVHRLDRETSGVLLFAKSEEAKNFLQNSWEDVTKIYLAIVEKKMLPPEGTLVFPLMENKNHVVYVPNQNSEGKYPEEAQESKTKYKTIQSGEGCSLLEIDLLTGRKNQIRVHMAHVGCPVINDKKYGSGKKRGSHPMALHSLSITFPHPFSKVPTTVVSPMPEFFNKILAPTGKKKEEVKP